MIIVDTSVVLSLLFEEAESAVARRVFVRAATEGGAVAPPLQMYKILSACTRALAAARLTPAQFDLVLAA